MFFSDFKQTGVKEDSNMPKIGPSRRRQERYERQARLGNMDSYMIEEKKYLKKESLTDCFIMLSSALKEENTGKVFDAIDVILRRIKSPNFSNDSSQIRYAKSRVVDALVKVYRNEIVRQYETIKSNGKIFFSTVPNNFSEDIYKYDPDAKNTSYARSILEEKYRKAIYGGYMHVVIGKIIEEYESGKNKSSAIKKPQGYISTKETNVNQDAYISEVKKNMRKIFGKEDNER